MRIIKNLIPVLILLLLPFAAVAGGSQEGTDTLGAGDATHIPGPIGDNDSGDAPVEVDGTNVDDESISAGEQGMAQDVPDSKEPAVAGTETDTTLGAGETAEAEAMTEPAALETIGDMRVRLSDVVGYDFGTGNVKDLVINQDSSIQYVVVNLDDSEGDFLLPPDMVTFTTAEGGILPAVNLGAGGTGDLSQVQPDDQAAGGDASASGMLAAGAVFATDLLDYEVLGSGNDRVGEIDDLVIDLQTGTIAYYAVASGGFLGIGENRVAVSPDAVQINPQDGTIVLNLSVDELEGAQGFGNDTWPADAELGVSTQGTLGAGDTAGAAGDTGTADSTGSD